jgi:hypothetical protein
VWLPSARPLKLFGLAHASQEPVSSLHSKVEPASEELNVKLGPVSFDGSAGFASMVVCGSVVSIVHV